MNKWIFNSPLPVKEISNIGDKLRIPANRWRINWLLQINVDKNLNSWITRLFLLFCTEQLQYTKMRSVYTGYYRTAICFLLFWAATVTTFIEWTCIKIPICWSKTDSSSLLCNFISDFYISFRWSIRAYAFLSQEGSKKIGEGINYRAWVGKGS